MKQLRFSITNIALLCCMSWITTLHAADNSSQATITLATSCSACHGPHGNSLGGTPTLAALNQEYFIQRMQGFKTGTVPATVMHQHAKGLTDEEIIALASYFSAQPRKTPVIAPHQAFKGAQ
jgi:cytochrome subunit of sulfide dehydrogenase